MLISPKSVNTVIPLFYKILLCLLENPKQPVTVVQPITWVWLCNQWDMGSVLLGDITPHTAFKRNTSTFLILQIKLFILVYINLWLTNKLLYTANNTLLWKGSTSVHLIFTVKVCTAICNLNVRGSWCHLLWVILAAWYYKLVFVILVVIYL